MDSPTPTSSADRPFREREGRAEPERRCILSGDRANPADLIRLALGPDGAIAPDVRARAPGRGAWLGVDRATLDAAQGKGKLKGALTRAFKGTVSAPADLGGLIEAALARDALDRLGLEARAGRLLVGSERIDAAARKGRVALLLHAADAGDDGRRKLDQALRVGLDREGSGEQGMTIPSSRAMLSEALGRENAVHVAITDRAAAARARDAIMRWRRFSGDGVGNAGCADPSPGSTAADAAAPLRMKV